VNLAPLTSERITLIATIAFTLDLKYYKQHDWYPVIIEYKTPKQIFRIKKFGYVPGERHLARSYLYKNSAVVGGKLKLALNTFHLSKNI
jgi:hypothetical protein